MISLLPLRNKFFLVAGAIVLMFILVAALFSGNMVQTAPTQAPQDEWRQVLGKGEARAVWETADHGYVVTGWRQGEADSGSGIFLVKVDAQGNRVWEKVFRGNGYSCGYSVQQTVDGGYVVAGDTKSSKGYDHDVYVVKTDDRGKVIWERTFGGDRCDYAWSICQTRDGGYIVAGGTESFGAGIYDVYLIKLNQEGEKEWERTYGGKGSDCGYAVLQLPDGGYLIAGTTESFGNGSNDVYLIRANENGDRLWEKTYGGPGSDYSWTLRKTLDGGYLLAGEKEFCGDNEGGYHLYLLKTDAGGNVEWEKTYGEKGCNAAYSACQTDDRGYLLVGKKETRGSHRIWVLKVDERGNRVWEKTYSGSGSEAAYDLQPASDGGYIIAGKMESASGSYACLIKLKQEPGVPEWCRWWSSLPLFFSALFATQESHCSSRSPAGGRSSPICLRWISFDWRFG
ncbi:MAG TPA: hypothetical protein DCE07_03145 [Peptococcaceae bacterium]|nr:hypothetical protein [Peptococcaceae bacterium]